MTPTPMSGPVVPAVLAAAPQSPPVTSWPARLALTALVLLAVAGLALLMRRGWRRRAARQADVPPLPPVPGDLGEPVAAAEGVYVSTTREGDELDRVVVHDLGVRAAAVMTVAADGVLWAREGAPDVFVPAAALRGARLARGMAGKFVGEGGLVVVTWEHGGSGFDTGFRARYGEDREVLLGAVRALAAEGSAR